MLRLLVGDLSGGYGQRFNRLLEFVDVDGLIPAALHASLRIDQVELRRGAEAELCSQFERGL